MRQSREAAAETRKRILDHAARLFRERGLEGVSVVDVMGAAGLTHGGFYKHFASKDDLVAEALEAAFAGVAARFDAEAAVSGPGVAARSYVATYLHPGHVERPGEGCPIAALGGEIGRMGLAARRAFENGVAAVASRLEAGLYSGRRDSRSRALALLSTLAGAVMAARAVESAGAREAILAAAAKAAEGMV